MRQGGILEIKTVFKGMDSSDAIKDYAAKRAEKIVKHIKEVVKCDFVFSTVRTESVVHLHVQAGHFHANAEARADDHNAYAAIDEVTDKLEYQARKYNEKLHAH